MCLHVQCEKEHGNKPGHEPPTHKIHDVFAKSKPSLDCHLSQIMVIPIQKNPAPEVDKIKTMEEYMATVTLNGKNRGLLFPEAAWSKVSMPFGFPPHSYVST